ncbi:unnamed protein product [Rotaria magnacalcarata]|uniref:Uncharacterized protein n=3 Tax=Rotaria magnacalcarata TaxID=392030 RepID=A0A816Z268_9BILA|nr:unnamed protein product [Rotaria magnacalcarata]
MLLLYFLHFLVFSSVFCRSEFCSEDKCLLPSCLCPTSNDNPISLAFTELPQFILLTFVGNLNRDTLDPIRSILNSTYRNPNKCPISSTFFINHVHTDYCLVQRLFDNQNEIAMTTSSNKCPLNNCYNESNWHHWTDDDWYDEIKQQRINIVEHARIHQSHIKGFRVPHLQIDENKHFEYLKRFHFHYDSSMLFKSASLMWPFTLDYPFDQTDCINCQQWNRSFEALWQFPLHEWTYTHATTSCRTLFDSSCLPTDLPHSIDLLFHFLLHNFERHASLSIGYRSPFIIQLDLSLLSQQNNNLRLQALIRFIEYILNSSSHRYVYFVSIEKALEWFKYPRSLSELRDFWAFSCNDKIYEYDIDCLNSESTGNDQEKIESLKSDGETNVDHSKMIDYQVEKLYPSGLAFHALWISVLLILSVLFYDKYFTSM